MKTNAKLYYLFFLVLFFSVSPLLEEKKKWVGGVGGRFFEKKKVFVLCICFVVSYFFKPQKSVIGLGEKIKRQY